MNSREVAEKWKANFHAACRYYIKREISQTQRVKIAILDSGVDGGHRRFNSERLKEIRSWVGDCEGVEEIDCVDEMGHGTHNVGLLLDLVPMIDIYVARIAERRPGDPDKVAKVGSWLRILASLFTTASDIRM